MPEYNKHNPAGRSWRRHWMSLALVALCTASVLGGNATPSFAKDSLSLSQLWKEVSRRGRYVAPSRAELRQAENLFLRTLSGVETIEELRSGWNELNLELLEHQIDDEQFWILREKQTTLTGRGFYAFRRHGAIPIALQAPHSFYDRHTQVIAARLFCESQSAAVAWNTLHRSIADLAHSRGNYIDAFTRAFVTVHATGIVVQLHGFSQGKRRTEAGASADMILSGGTMYPSQWLQRSAAAMQQRFPHGSVKLFPHDVMELGAITNVQGEILRSTSSNRFMHVEMSDPLRVKMRGSRSVRSDFLKSLSESY